MDVKKSPHVRIRTQFSTSPSRTDFQIVRFLFHGVIELITLSFAHGLCTISYPTDHDFGISTMDENVTHHNMQGV
ncbi:hypothetical protein I79_002088 [Cricetulus griseus]|uniref:Uncharacterized protein n=1 Tax=Cricetulus griseus TaxID=10029 RepID=G3GWG4_CRIGR|nr:hypothetical protein I79_002088 [Cricetulus griseus]